MNSVKGLAIGFGVAALMVVVAACGQPQSATPTPTVAPADTPSAMDGRKLREANLELPDHVEVVRMDTPATPA